MIYQKQHNLNQKTAIYWPTNSKFYIISDIPTYDIINSMTDIKTKKAKTYFENMGVGLIIALQCRDNIKDRINKLRIRILQLRSHIKNTGETENTKLEILKCEIKIEYLELLKNHYRKKIGLLGKIINNDLVKEIEKETKETIKLFTKGYDKRKIEDIKEFLR